MALKSLADLSEPDQSLISSVRNALTHWKLDPSDPCVSRALLFYLYEVNRLSVLLPVDVRRELASLFGVSSVIRESYDNLL